MSFRDDAQSVLDITYAQFGEDAVWTPSYGQAISVRVIPDEADAIADVAGRGRRNVTRRVFNIRAAEINAKAPGLQPKVDDLLQFNGLDFRAINQPNRLDPLQLEWTLDCAV